jgi:hypothetical protein
MIVSIITALFLLVSSYNLEVVGWIIALVGSMALLWSRSTVLSVPAGLVRILVIPSLLLCLGLHGIYRNSLYDVGKDIWYFSGPVLYTCFGYLVFERLRTWQRLVQPLVIMGAYASLVIIVGIVSNRDLLLASSSVEEYREFLGIHTFVPLLPTIVLVFMRKVGLPTVGVARMTAVRAATYTLSAMVVILTFSRTHMFCLAAGLVWIVNPRFTPRRLRNYTAVLLGGAVVLAVMLGIFHGDRVGALLQSFVEKTSNTASEVDVHSYETFEDINMNWRGFEASRAEKTYDGFSDIEKLVGGGFGTMVDLGFAMKLAGSNGREYLEFISILHNGYMELLVKTGLLGLSLFIAFIIQIVVMMFFEFRKSDKCAKLNGLLLLWAVFVFVITQGAIAGILNKGELAPVLFLLGATCASASSCDRYVSLWHELGTSQPAANASCAA